MGIFQKGDRFPRGLRKTGEAREHEAYLMELRDELHTSGSGGLSI